ncbi:ATP-binding protein [Kitasatospora viridis]|uniref:ATP-binding protein n=1 Tax=Kitasatospora viridis TaxID=281105 RepID=UPI0011A8922B|nr:ATP-binding protein [Kitasatospora viridis]
MAQPSGEFGQENLRVRSGEVVAGQYLVTVAGVDGSDVQPCPVYRRPAVPSRPVAVAAPPAAGPGPDQAVGPLALGAGPGDLPLLDREAEVAHLLGMLAEGRSIRLLGEPGSGRSALLAAVAGGAGELAPHGVVKLCGHRRSADDLLQDLFAAAYRTDGYRPDRAQLAELLAGLGAVVVIDEVVPDGAELEELLATAPECAFLITVAPGSGGALPVGSRLEDHVLGGLTRPACLTLVARLAGRPLDEAERAWVVDLWFESQGLPLRFVQAAALLRRRDAEVDALLAAEEERGSLFGRSEPAAEHADPAVREAELRQAVPLPTVAETAAPALRLTEGLGEEALVVLRLAVALGGEFPTAPHLPALIDVDHGESALRELTECGLAEPLGGHHRLTSGVLAALAAHWGTDPEVTEGAAEHFGWWVGHGSVSTAQIAAEAEVVLGALHAERAADRPVAVLGLARAAAPALALTLRWGAWREVLELGAAVAEETGSTRDEAWFRHELGVHWLCLGEAERARAALEAAGRLRSAAGDSRGSVASRRLLTMVQRAVPAPVVTEAETQVIRRPVIRALADRPWPSASVLRGWSRRNVLLAAGGLVALAAVGTAVGLMGGSSTGGSAPAGGTGGGGGVSGSLLTGATGSPAGSSAAPSGSGSASASPSATVSASASATGGASAPASASASRSRSAGASASATANSPGSPNQPVPPVTAPATSSAPQPTTKAPSPQPSDPSTVPVASSSSSAPVTTSPSTGTPSSSTGTPKT